MFPLELSFSKVRSFNGRTRFCSIPFVIRVTPETIDLKISAAAKVVVKARKLQNELKFANINFETWSVN